MTKLKPCPFCGGIPSHDGLEEDADTEPFIGCSNKSCFIYYYWGGAPCTFQPRTGQSIEDFIKQWNTRAGEK
jgi:hypothetical protein